jgi:hypothetical protein
MSNAQLRCRFCQSPLRTSFVDLGMSPLCQTHIAPEQLQDMEPFYPLHAYVCEQCHLVQLQQFVAPDAMVFSRAGVRVAGFFDSAWMNFRTP